MLVLFNKDVTLHFKISTTLAFLVLILSACGGGADSIPIVKDDTPAKPNTTPTPSEFTISTNNVETAASIAITSTFNNFALNTSSIFTQSTIEKTAVQLQINTRDQVLKPLKRAISSGAAYSEDVNAITTDCAISGTLTTTINFQKTFSLSLEDSVKIEAMNCHDGSSITNGSFTYQFTQLTDFNDFDDYTVLGLDMIFDKYSINFLEKNKEVTVTSMYSLLITQDEYSQKVDISSPVLGIVVNDYLQLIQNLEIEKTYIHNTNIETITASSDLHDNALFGLINITTLDGFEFYGQESDAPTSGRIKITAEDNSSIILTVLNTNDVQLDADYNADDVIDETRVVSWESLLYP